MSTDTPPRFCVLIPVYNHPAVLAKVIAGARKHFPVIVVDDGSTDETPNILAREADIVALRLPQNVGKAGALQAGFRHAEQLGYTHAITIDADGQHPTEALPEFAAASRRNPEAFIIGVRDLKAAGAPLPRRLSNAMSTISFRLETGVPLTDTQCGFRVYPLRTIARLPIHSDRYAYELEIMVKAVWAGYSLVAQPVQSDYAAPTSRMSHFHPWRDFWRVFRVHSRLSTQAICVPAPLRQLAARGRWAHLSRAERWRTAWREVYSEHAHTPGRLAAAVGIGLFCGIAPIWGAQMLVAALLAHKLRLNKAIALTASNISFPLAAPFVMAAGLVMGHYLFTGRMVAFDPHTAAQNVPSYLAEWAVGSVVLGALAGVAGAGLAYVAARLLQRAQPPGENE